MFGSSDNKDPAPAKSDPGSVIAKGMQLAGEFSGDGDVLLQGQYNGSIRCRTLTIGETGRMEGKIRAQRVVVKGSVQGEIRAKQVVLHNTAHVTGDVYHEILEVAAGAKVEGRYSRKLQEKAQVGAKLLDNQKEMPPRAPMSAALGSPSAKPAPAGSSNGSGQKLPAAE
ncbi:bactofilin family protein [Aestuariispira insulae]|uniref:Cytoskeletal protein CcmA (Bactofilin family) n=1 Tax=Aestuariispira insulae TaxID=1461337 RepID=A0A3D9HWX4_9PROT|nr:polymer-forming cytoskeletal protein [Aestuariispira insulae]RED54004.1 cytoskeletal protein CcmA (bactofilin family) [Aestuariispira insulae]